MRYIKYAIFVMLFVFNAYAIETSYKHDQLISGEINSNYNYEVEYELEVDAEFSNNIDYQHLQMLIGSPVNLFDLSAGLRLINEPDSIFDDTTLALMLQSKYNFNINEFKIKNRLRYLYFDKEQEHVIRYRIGIPIDLVYGITFTPSAEVFIDEQFNYKRTRYASFISKPINNWNIKLGYEYNDNNNKDNSQTIVTELDYSF